VGTAGSPYAAFQRALRNGNLPLALGEARHLPRLGAADALALLLLIREKAPERYGRAAARWLARWLAETPDADLEDGIFVLAALRGLTREDPRTAALSLVALARERHDRQLELVLRRWLDDRVARSAHSSAPPPLS
jgi:hypothetical protein